MSSNLSKEEVKFWSPIIGGIVLTLIYIFDIRASVNGHIDELKTRVSIIEIKVDQLVDASKVVKVPKEQKIVMGGETHADQQF